MRVCMLGDTGSGKTALLVNFLYECYLNGYVVYANIKLNFPYIHVNTINFFEAVDNMKKNAVGIDEIGEEEKGTPQFKFTQLISQSRKSLGENHHLFMTTQTKYQTNPTLRGLLDAFVFPCVLERSEEVHPVYGTRSPIWVKAEWYWKVPRHYPVAFLPRTDLPDNLVFRYTKDSNEMYDTFLETENLKDTSYLKYLDKYKDYIGEKRCVRKLTVLIQQQEGFNKTNSKDLALTIVNAYEFFPDYFVENG